MIFRRKSKQGEHLVWLTGMGLALGLIMVVGLLSVLVLNGLEAFWPQRIVQIQLKTGVKSPIGSEQLAGELVKEQTTEEGVEEWQLFIGNKEDYGQSFVFVNANDILKKSYPKDILSVERLEYGDALMYPKQLLLADGKEISVEQPTFNAELKRLVSEVESRWDQIREIERIDIGSINHSLENLRYEQKKLESGTLTAEIQQRLNSLEEEKRQLQQQYEKLAAKAKELRQEQVSARLSYWLPSGEEKMLHLGQILHTYYPNQLSWLARVGLMFRNMGHFLIEEPREANTEGGIFPAIFGTFIMTVLMSLAVTPFGVIAAVYLREYARQGLWVRMVRIAVNNLAGVPSIVFGVFGLGFFVYLIGGSIDQFFFSHRLPTPTFGTGGLLWASLTLALMTVPVVIVATEEALAAVGQGLREASLACGASKWQTIQRIVLPAAGPGILTGMVLAMARGAGEVAPLMLVGVVKLAPELPLNMIAPYIHLDQKFMHLGFHIYDLGFQSPDSEAAKPMVFATTLLLIALIFTLNIGAIFIRERLRRRYSSGAF